MTPEELIEAFDAVAEAPEGITRLRELVLQLAVRGRLVPQDLGDTPIEIEAQRSAKNRTEHEWQAIQLEELPQNWVCAPLVSVGRWGSGGTPRRGISEYYEGDIPWLKIGDLNDGMVTCSEQSITRAGFENSSAKMIPINAVLVAMYGSIGKAGISGFVCCSNQAIAHCVLDPDVMVPEYMLRLILALRRDLLAQGKGGAQSNISQTVLKHLRVPIPPLAEQQRIVARVDELMGLLDRLEATRSAREATRTAARDAALAALRDADTQEEVEAAWDRVAGRMDDLFTDPADVEPLRQTVLQLAVRGRLVPQDPEDEPASVLFEQIRTDKAAFIEEHGLRRVRKMKKIEAGEVPHPIPDNWVWCRLGTIANAQPGFAFNAAQFNDIGEGEPLIRIRDVLGGATSTFYSGEFRDEYIVSTGDYLIGMDGNFNIGRWKSGRALLNQRVARLRWYSSSVESGYVVRPLQQRLDQLYGVKTYTTVQHLSGKQIEDALIPLPPRAEQERIVARVDELMGLLDRLEAHLRGKTDLQDEFATAAVHHLEAS